MPFINTADLKVVEPLPGWKGRFLHSEHMTFMHYTVDAGASSIQEHHHPNEEVWTVLEGEFEVTIDGVTQTAGPGSVAIAPSNATHSIRALTAGRVIVVNYPLRHTL